MRSLSPLQIRRGVPIEFAAGVLPAGELEGPCRLGGSRLCEAVVLAPWTRRRRGQGDGYGCWGRQVWLAQEPVTAQRVRNSQGAVDVLKVVV